MAIVVLAHRDLPTDLLELRAAEQRRRLHSTVAALLGLLLGYAVASVFA